MRISNKVRILNFLRKVWMIPVLETWLARQTLGLSPDHFICKWVPNPYQYPAGTLRTLERDGIRMVVDISDYIGHYLYFGFEDLGMQHLFALCNDTSNVVDVGANIGWTSLRLAHRASRGIVFGFEPDPYNLERCMENVKRNRLRNLEVFPIGLGNEEAIVNIEVRTPSNRGGNRIAPRESVLNRPVQISKMDDVGPLKNLERIDLIKIDVEGYELQVLKGAGAILRKHKPVLFIELDDNNLRDQGDSAGHLVQYLRDLGYGSFINAENGLRIDSMADFGNCHMDIVVRS